MMDIYLHLFIGHFNALQLTLSFLNWQWVQGHRVLILFFILHEMRRIKITDDSHIEDNRLATTGAMIMATETFFICKGLSYNTLTLNFCLSDDNIVINELCYNLYNAKLSMVCILSKVLSILNNRFEDNRRVVRFR